MDFETVKNFGTSLVVPSVQELAKQPITEVPERYVRPNQDPPILPQTTSLLQIPVIDLSKLLSDDSTELEKLDHACQEWGFFQWSFWFVLIGELGTRRPWVEWVVGGLTRVSAVPMEVSNNGSTESEYSNDGSESEFFDDVISNDECASDESEDEEFDRHSHRDLVCSGSGSDTRGGVSEGFTVSKDVKNKEVLIDDDDDFRPPNDEDLIGKEFGTVDDAYKFYVKYARYVGFGVRKGDIGRNKWGIMTRRTFFCCKQGLRDKKHYERDGRKREAKVETRTNCKARMVVSLRKGGSSWNVRKIVKEHNHPVMPQKFVHLIRNHRHISDASKVQIRSMHRHGMKSSQIMGFLAGQSGGYGSIGFSRKDMSNFIDQERVRKILHGDAEAAISYLEGRADADGMTVARFTVTEDERLGNLFWADGHSRVDYQYFGDVLAFDSTYKKNKYNKPLVVFSGQNHHRQSCMFGFALLVDETIETYEWVLEQFLDVMADKHPSVVVTDGDEAMKEGIRRVFPNAVHRLCAWHLQKNAVANVKSEEFCAALNVCMYANLTIDEFTDIWNQTVDQCCLKDNPWVRGLFERKEMWATAYLRDKFCAGIKTTSRCEGINAQIKRFIRSRASVLELVQNLERALSEYRNNELEAQFQSIYTHPVYDTGLESIEVGAQKVYTRTIFKEVKKQILAISSLILHNRERFSTSVKYQLCKFGKPNRMYEVYFDKVGDDKGPKICCDCCLWAMEGIPCSHIFFVMKEEHIPEVPCSLVLKRWRKDAKSFDDDASVEDNNKRQILRYGALCSASLWMSFLASKSGPYFKRAMDMVIGVTNELERREVGSEEVFVNGGAKGVGDPLMAKTKGAPKARKNGRKRMCSNCGMAGHTKRTCIGNKYDFFEPDDAFMGGMSSNDWESSKQNALSEGGSSRTKATSPKNKSSTNRMGEAKSGSDDLCRPTYGNVFFGGQYINHLYPVVPNGTGPSAENSINTERQCPHDEREGGPFITPRKYKDPGHQFVLQHFIDRANRES